MLEIEFQLVGCLANIFVLALKNVKCLETEKINHINVLFSWVKRTYFFPKKTDPNIIDYIYLVHKKIQRKANKSNINIINTLNPVSILPSIWHAANKKLLIQ